MILKKRYFEYFIHGLIWITGLIIVLYNVKTIGLLKESMGSYTLAVVIGTLFNLILFYLVSLYLIPRFNLSESRGKLISFLIIFTVGLSAIESLIDYYLMPVIYSSEEEPYMSQLIVILVFHVFILALALAYGFTREWIRKDKNQQELKSEKLSAELNYLKAQVNPHSLFNMLNMAFASATKNGDEYTANLIEMISSQLRYMLYESNFEKVSVQKEIDHINSFIEIQKLRISDDMPVKINYRTEGDFSTNSVAPLLLIPFIENAFKHGLHYNANTNIDIQISCQNQQLELKVSNPINQKQVSVNNQSSGIGLENVKKRLELIYPNKYTLQVNEEPDIYSIYLNLNLN
ncbi:sensor histidine kinase [Marinifilum flexuosum]|uniref:Histidine kinase n=1 Tax=Marinifilum flexuosum TaxID=1117708 RepID=A0A419WTG8_9BACT|nr:histidine kinase [Marinifilum flexuosum]RKD98769.1 histidine kinase [Marinifilum flexuosum]